MFGFDIFKIMTFIAALAASPADAGTDQRPAIDTPATDVPAQTAPATPSDDRTAISGDTAADEGSADPGPATTPKLVAPAVPKQVIRTVQADDAEKSDDESDDKNGTGKELTVNDVVDGMQAYYDQANTFSANFKQNYEEVTGVNKVSEGQLFFKKGGKMRWDYSKPEEKYLIANGETFWAWEPKYNQYCKQSISDSTLPTALTFLSGGGDIREDFIVRLAGETEKRYQVQLTPKEANPNYKLIEFNIRKGNFRVDQVIVEDDLGNLNNLYFMQAEINGDLPDDNFEFSPPADATHMCEG